MSKKYFSELVTKIKSRVSPPQRREPRFRMLPLHNVILELETHDRREEVAVGNISTNGIGILWSQGSVPPHIVLKSRLKVSGEEFSVTLEARHQTRELLGCQFVDASEKLTEAIRRFLQVELRAIELSRITDSDHLQDKRGRANLYSDKTENEIYYITSHGKIVYFHLIFLGLYVEGGSRKHLMTARISSSSKNMAVLGKNPSAYLDSDETISNETVQLGWRLVESADCLEPGVRKELQSLLVMGKG